MLLVISTITGPAATQFHFWLTNFDAPPRLPTASRNPQVGIGEQYKRDWLVWAKGDIHAHEIGTAWSEG